MRSKVVGIHEICHGFVFADEAVVVVAVHVPDLGEKQKNVGLGKSRDLPESSTRKRCFTFTCFPKKCSGC